MRFSDLDGAAVGIWGVGRETRSFALQLARRLPSASIAAIASDDPVAAETLGELHAPGARVVRGAEVVDALAACDVIVRSPGVSVHRPELKALRLRGRPIATATGLWFAETRGVGVIGVTGTKGKSTTSMLTAHLAATTGCSVQLAGNIGVPALDLLDAPPVDVTVIELSSYQIADLEAGPEVAVVTNLYPEHLDWHRTHEAYRLEKLRILALPGVRAAVVNARDETIAAAAANTVEVLPFGVPDGWDHSPAGIRRQGRLVVRAEDLPLPGAHNALNLCAALTAIEAAGRRTPKLPSALEGIHPLPHRLEVVGERDGIVWVDDSISTTPESTLAALACFPDRRIVLLAGGQDRGQDYEALARVLAQLRAAVVGVPVTGARLVAAARAAGVPSADALESADLDEAVPLARTLAATSGVVLLSPAAPSYNAYSSFEARSRHFRALARPWLS